jgi:hypothetical protein
MCGGKKCVTRHILGISAQQRVSKFNYFAFRGKMES